MSKNRAAVAEPVTETTAPESTTDEQPTEPEAAAEPDEKTIELGSLATTDRRHYFNIAAPAGRITNRALVLSAHESVLDELAQDDEGNPVADDQGEPITLRAMVASFEADLVANLHASFPGVTITEIGADLSFRLMLDSEESAKSIKRVAAGPKPKLLAWDEADVDASQKLCKSFLTAVQAKAKELAGDGKIVTGEMRRAATEAISPDWGTTLDGAKSILASYQASLLGL